MIVDQHWRNLRIIGRIYTKREGLRITFFQSLSAAGFGATAISFGPARMGFGLFVPEFKSAFSMSSSAVGLVSSLGFAGFFVGLLIAQFLLNRRGPKFPVLTGLAAATIGMGIVALSPSVFVLALGVFLAASSAGFAWTPFNDAVHRKIRDVDRPTALSEISTGTSLGIAGAGALAFAMVYLGLDWRTSWAVFAGVSALTLVGNWAALNKVDKGPEVGPEQGWSDVLHPVAMPIFGIAFVYGITSAIYISFAADYFAQEGLPGLSESSTSSFVFIFCGIFGLAGLLTNRVRSMIGLTWLIRALLITAAAALALVALMPGVWLGVGVSAGLQGINIMMTSAVLAFWSERLFPTFPSLGFTITLLATATGSVIGPLIAGLISDKLGPEVMFYGTAVIPLFTAGILQRRFVVERPAKA
ncbi:MFS transporter [Marivita sp. XM-24bin2]|uniref:MFS transporter n=1 Tax=Marivita sp. XM-24bin2 TaxID=2133951 RepID=UPI0025C67658|nr:MFS transporter [Marivita sp. XM-24bin2]